ncbi:TPA: phage capsid protein [Clostridioides difficile]
MFSKILTWIREVLKKMTSDTGVDSVSDILISSEMTKNIELWSSMYQDSAYWIDNKNVFSLNLSSSISSEIARLTTIEMDSKITGSLRADFLNEQFEKVLKNIRIQLEYACAKGSIIFKPYVLNGNIEIDYIHADSFFPTSFDSSGKIMGVVFVDQKIKNNKIFTRLESHNLTKDGCLISNKAYVSSNNNSLGREISLQDVEEWADIQEQIVIKSDRLLFGYFKVPLANTIDTKSPLGVSVYSRATGLIRKADEQYSRLLWEFEGSELAINASEDLFARDINGNAILPRGKERLYRKLEIDTLSTTKTFFEPFSPAIRDVSLINGLNEQLRRIEFNCNLAYGTLSDPNNVDKTAEEIKASKQRSYAFVSDLQKELKNALKDLVYAMDALTTTYNLVSPGRYEQSFDFDDSLIVDNKTEQSIKLQEVASGILKPERYLMWRYGVTEEQAKEMMPDEAELIGE